MAKDEFIEVYLKLIAAHTVVGSDQPLLEVAHRAVRQKYHGLRSFAQVDLPRLVPRHVFEPASCSPVKLLRPSVYSVEPGATFCLRNAVSVAALKSGITAIRARPVPRPRFSTATMTSAAFRPLSCRLPRKPA